MKYNAPLLALRITHNQISLSSDSTWLLTYNVHYNQNLTSFSRFRLWVDGDTMVNGRFET